MSEGRWDYKRDLFVVAVMLVAAACILPVAGPGRYEVQQLNAAIEIAVSEGVTREDAPEILWDSGCRTEDDADAVRAKLREYIRTHDRP